MKLSREVRRQVIKRLVKLRSAGGSSARSARPESSSTRTGGVRTQGTSARHAAVKDRGAPRRRPGA